MTDMETIRGIVGQPTAWTADQSIKNKVPTAYWVVELETLGGYTGFTAELYFDKDGKYVSAGAWE